MLLIFDVTQLYKTITREVFSRLYSQIHFWLNLSTFLYGNFSLSFQNLFNFFIKNLQKFTIYFQIMFHKIGISYFWFCSPILHNDTFIAKVRFPIVAHLSQSIAPLQSTATGYCDLGAVGNLKWKPYLISPVSS